MSFIRNVKKQKGCIFCKANKPEGKDCVIFKTVHTLALLNIFPYNNGHLMITPLRHVADFSSLKEAELLDLCKSITRAKKLLDKVVKPKGYNIGINLGTSAGAGIPKHLHIHIVPRWNGDTNFMTTLYATKIISQSLKELQRLLIKADK